jgi:hypothetical protein
MKNTIEELRLTLERCFAAQASTVALWHEQDPQEPSCPEQASPESLGCRILAQHRWNFLLWHVEDAARRGDVPDSVIADCKRRVDTLNQKRNDAMEKVDDCLYHLLAPHLPVPPPARRNTETVGMAVDRLSILALKIYHMEEQVRRVDAGADHVQSCAGKLRVLRRQREDLRRAVLELIEDYIAGNKEIFLYSQCKMYNDPNLNPEIYAHRKA